MAEKAELDDPALAWAVRTADPGFDDWDTFQGWLESDASHASRFHAYSVDVAAMSELLRHSSAPLADSAVATTRRSSLTGKQWFERAIAVCAVASIGYLAIDQLPRPMTVETLSGATRTIALADGSSIMLNGATRIVLDRNNPRTATLDRGEALFSVRHDATRSFRVTVGGDQIVDLGTEFSVTRDAAVTRVAVSEGEVAFNPDQGNIRLRAGRALTMSEATRTVAITTVATSAVGAWRYRQLIYTGTPLGSVAADLSRSLGVTIVAAPNVAARPYRGTIALTGLAKDPAALAPLLDVTLSRSGTTWTMTQRP